MDFLAPGFQQATATSDSASASSSIITQTGAAAPLNRGASGAGLFGLALAAFVL